MAGRPSVKSLTPVKPRSRGRGLAITPEQKRVYWDRREAGYSIRKASNAANFNPSTGMKMERAEKFLHVDKMTEAGAPQPPPPVAATGLSPEAERALETFPYFCRRYFGLVPVPWQEEAAETVIKLLHSEDKEYVVINAPPSVGKSTTFTLCIAAWVTVKDRSIRGQIGSYTLRQAQLYLERLKREFERVIPIHGTPVLVDRGVECDAESTLALDYGRFKPLDRAMWTNQQFIIMQTTGIAIAEKEPTWSAFGKDSGFMGGRYDLVIWDDLVDPRKVRSQDARDELRSWYFDVAESRLEPGGLMVLQGQRLGPDDLYRTALDQTLVEFDDDGEEIEGTEAKLYKHVVFKAHYETRCKGALTHKATSAPYPDGCLLYPKRLTWKEIAGLMANRSERFGVMYQQEDSDPEDQLVQMDWVTGAHGNPGCLDRERDRLEVPPRLDVSQCISVVTCDPSPTENWAICWWLFHPETQYRYLIDLHRGRMDAPDLLDYDLKQRAFVGLMDDWQRMSRTLGIPITYWVVEINAAQRFLLQSDYIQRWQEMNRVTILPHTTGRNKSDPDYGVWCIAPHFRYGRYRLPGRGQGMVRSQWLIDEVTKYPNGRTDDIVMATWFLDWNSQNLGPARRTPSKPQFRPSWVRSLARR